MPTSLLADRYQLESCVAIGGMGEVWRGRDLAASRAVAVKLLRDRYANDAVAVARFEAEARCAGRVGHPGVVQVYDFGARDRPFLVMELVEGSSLAQVLAHGPLGTRSALDVVVQLADALQAAHQAGVVHRDVKPANVLIGPGGKVKLTDFGIAHSDDVEASGRASAGTVLGTAAYLAPERLTGEEATAAADLYSLGVVLFECLTGVRPFSGTLTEIALAHRIGASPALPGTVPFGVRALTARLMSKDRSARPGSAAVVGAQAAALRDQLGGSEHGPGGPGWPGGPGPGGPGWPEHLRHKHAASRRPPAAVTLVDRAVA